MIYCWINYHQSYLCLFLSVFVSICLSVCLSVCLSGFTRATLWVWIQVQSCSVGIIGIVGISPHGGVSANELWVCFLFTDKDIPRVYCPMSKFNFVCFKNCLFRKSYFPLDHKIVVFGCPRYLSIVRNCIGGLLAFSLCNDIILCACPARDFCKWRRIFRLRWVLNWKKSKFWDCWIKWHRPNIYCFNSITFVPIYGDEHDVLKRKKWLTTQKTWHEC